MTVLFWEPILFDQIYTSAIVVLQTFILQLEGKTKWKLFKPLQELPQEASPDLELSDIGEASHEFDMEVLNVFCNVLSFSEENVSYAMLSLK